MKKYIKTAIIFIFCLLIFSVTKQVKANSIDSISMDIYIKENGDAQVTETWNCRTTEGTEVYHPYYNLGNSEIKDLQVTDNGSLYRTLSIWNTSGTLSSKANKCGINKISNGVELCWGISTYGTHTYQIQYTITKFVSQLNDSQMVYWTLIPYEFSNSIGNVDIKIHADQYFPETIDVWGYGNYGGLCYVDSGSIYMSSNGRLSTSEYMIILAKFPIGTFTTTNKLNNNFNYYYEMAEEGSTRYDKQGNNSNTNILPTTNFVFLMLFNIISYILAIFIVVYAISKITKKSKNITVKFNKESLTIPKKVDYFREIPCKKDIYRAYYVAYQFDLVKKKTYLLGAIILKWIKEKKVRVEQKETGKTFKREDTVIVLNETDSSMIENSYEKDLFNMLYEASNDGILEDKEFEKWCKRSYSRVLRWFDKIIEKEQETLINEKLIIENQRKFLKFFTKKEYVVQPQLRQEAIELAGLKRYLKEYTLIEDRKAIEVTLFEEYLIYAQIMGIAKEVAKEFKDLYPEIIEQSSYNSLDNIIFITICANNGIYKAESAKSAAEIAAMSYSSGGGGFSSGGGGRGSFGGGGGRRRFPLINLIKISVI